MLSREEYLDYYKRYKMLWKYLKTCSIEKMTVYKEICSIRGYNTERMIPILHKADFIYLDMAKVNLENVKNYGDDLAVFNKEGYFLLKDRYLFPVKDMLGNIITIIGWYPDDKKYVTCPSKLFSKECLFYGMEQLGESGLGRRYYVVEGIFDCLSIRSLGINCVAMMGIDSSRYKEVVYSLFKQIVAVPDADEMGRDVLLNDKWRIPRNGKYFRWKTSGNRQIKDIDKLINMFDETDVRELLIDVFSENQRIVSIKI